MTSRLNIPDLAFAVFLVALGALAFALSNQLTIGSAASMGPGYVPRGLAILIMVYGLALGIRAIFSGRQSFPEIAFRPLLLISASVALFAIVLPLVGLAVTSAAVVICAGFAAYDVRLRENAVLALVLSAFAVLLFVKALGLPIAVWWWQL
jgi:putative tricarboxylic transport membrane protein